MYITKDVFTSRISSEFAFLKEIGFQEIGYNPASRGYSYYYSTNQLTVRIHYSLTNDWLDVDFLFQPLDLSTIPNDENSIMLMTLLSYLGIHNHGEMMPKSVGFTESAKMVAEKVKSEAWDIITGKFKITAEEALKVINPNRFT